MRTFLISIAAVAATAGFAAPASAQWAPPAPYGAPAYGYAHGYGHVHALQARVDMIQRHIVTLDRRNILSNREARQLREQSRQVERQLRRASRYGLNPHEARNIEVRIARLEQRVQRDAWDRDRRRDRDYGWRR